MDWKQEESKSNQKDVERKQKDMRRKPTEAEGKESSFDVFAANTCKYYVSFSSCHLMQSDDFVMSFVASLGDPPLKSFVPSLPFLAIGRFSQAHHHHIQPRFCVLPKAV